LEIGNPNRPWGRHRLPAANPEQSVRKPRPETS
jgi:hypothetical protein